MSGLLNLIVLGIEERSPHRPYAIQSKDFVGIELLVLLWSSGAARQLRVFHWRGACYIREVGVLWKIIVLGDRCILVWVTGLSDCNLIFILQFQIRYLQIINLISIFKSIARWRVPLLASRILPRQIFI